MVATGTTMTIGGQSSYPVEARQPLARRPDLGEGGARGY